MKKVLFIAAAVSIILSACKSNTGEQKAVQDDIYKIHEKVMDKEDALMRNKMKIDTLLKQNPQPDVKTTATTVSAKLVQADDAMSNWMQKFNPDYKGKNGEESLNYFKEQRAEVIRIDSQMNAAISESDKFLSQIKK
jgi:hypothetical protein